MLVNGIDQGAGHIGTVALGDETNTLVDGALKLNQAVVGAGFVVERNDLQFLTAQHAPLGVEQVGHVLKMLMADITDIGEWAGKALDIGNLDGLGRHDRAADHRQKPHTCQKQN